MAEQIVVLGTLRNAVTRAQVETGENLLSVHAVAQANNITQNHYDLAARLRGQLGGAFTLQQFEVGEQLVVLGTPRNGVTRAQIEAGDRIVTVGVAAANAITPQELAATMLLQANIAHNGGNNGNALADPSANAIRAVMAATATGQAKLGTAVAWAIQRGFGTQGRGSVPNGAAVCHGQGGRGGSRWVECYVEYPAGANRATMALGAGRANLYNSWQNWTDGNRFTVRLAENGAMPAFTQNDYLVIHQLTVGTTAHYVAVDGVAVNPNDLP